MFRSICYLYILFIRGFFSIFIRSTRLAMVSNDKLPTIFRFLIFLSGCFMLSCASSSLQVTSKPSGAEVYIVDQGRPPVRLGETPLTLTTEQVTQQVKESATILISKEGFDREQILIPKIAFSSNVTVATNLNEQTNSSVCQNAEETLKKAVRDVAEIQNLIYQKQFDRALFMIENLISKYPQIAVFHDLRGNIFYLQKVSDQALASYQSSLRLDPTNSETQRMVQKLESILGAKSTPGGNP